jgi:hypothetical protein
VEVVGDAEAADVAAFLVLDGSGVVGEVELVGREADEGAGEEFVPCCVELGAGMAHEGLGRGAVFEEFVDVSHGSGCLWCVSDGMVKEGG